MAKYELKGICIGNQYIIVILTIDIIEITIIEKNRIVFEVLNIKASLS